MNFYLTGIEGMPKLLDCCNDDPMKYFSKKTYADAFHRMYQEHVPTFDAIEQGYLTVIDKEQFLTNMADALAAYGAQKYAACPKRSKRDHLMMDLNLTMAAFVLPMILEFHGESSGPLAQKATEAWKRQFPKSALKASEYRYIEEGFHKKFCYITTAVCESFGRQDDCYELRTLRSYRDGYLASRPDGAELIHLYYDVAPSIVKHINRRENRKEIYESIWEQYLAPCISMIEEGRLADCEQRYEEMVFTLKDQYFLS